MMDGYFTAHGVMDSRWPRPTVERRPLAATRYTHHMAPLARLDRPAPRNPDGTFRIQRHEQRTARDRQQIAAAIDFIGGLAGWR